MKKFSVGDLVFLEVATTVCYMAVWEIKMDPVFLSLVGTVFGAYFAYSRLKQKEPDFARELPSKQI